MAERDKIQSVIERLIQEVWNEKRLDEVSEVFLPDVTVHLSSGALHSAEALRDEFIKPTQEAFPDFRHTIVDLIVEGDNAAMRYKGAGTHQGDFDGKAATGKTLSYEGIVFFRMEGVHVAEVWNHSNWPERFSEL